MVEPGASPIAIFAYNRADKLAAMMQTLVRCHGFSSSPVKIFVDGPRSESDRDAVERVRQYVSTLNYDNISYSFRTENIGLRRSIYAGVTELCERFGKVIVLEDDFLLSPDIIVYFDEALRKYTNCFEIWSVCAYMPQVSELRRHDSALLLPTSHPWGWATWQRAWKNFDLDAPIDPRNLQSYAFRQRFNMYGLKDYAAMLRLATGGKLDSWFIRWNYLICTRNGLSVFPPRSLVMNDGYDGGTHASRWNVFSYFLHKESPNAFDFKLPDERLPDLWAIDGVVNSRESTLARWSARFGAIKRTIL